MKLTCDKCQRSYNFPDGLRSLFYAGAPHAILPIGASLNCDGTLQPDMPLPSAEIDFRALARKQESSESSNTSDVLGG